MMSKNLSNIAFSQQEFHALSEQNIPDSYQSDKNSFLSQFSSPESPSQTSMTMAQSDENSKIKQIKPSLIARQFLRPQLNIKKFSLNQYENQQNTSDLMNNDISLNSTAAEIKSVNSAPQVFTTNVYIQKYEQLEKLGEGMHAVVYKVRNYQTNKMYAAKVIKCDNEEMRQIIEQEYKIMQMLEDPHIIRPEEFIYDEEKETIIIIQELFEGKSLSSFLNSKSKKQQLNQEDIIKIITQLLSTVKYLHANKIVHRDITIMNILYDFDVKVIKLIDFGIAKEFLRNSEEFMISATCNKIFGPPECTNSENYFVCEKVDEYGCGLVLLSMLENQKIISSKIPKVIENNKHFANQNNVYSISLKLLKENPEQRITADEALALLSQI